MNKLTIGVYYSHIPEGSNEPKWEFLEETTTYLNRLGFEPRYRDKIKTVGKDAELLISYGLKPFQTILTVKERIIGYGNYDLSLLCRYEPFSVHQEGIVKTSVGFYKST